MISGSMEVKGFLLNRRLTRDNILDNHDVVTGSAGSTAALETFILVLVFADAAGLAVDDWTTGVGGLALEVFTGVCCCGTVCEISCICDRRDLSNFTSSHVLESSTATEQNLDTLPMSTSTCLTEVATPVEVRCNCRLLTSLNINVVLPDPPGPTNVDCACFRSISLLFFMASTIPAITTETECTVHQLCFN